MLDYTELAKATKTARNLQELLAKLGYGINGDFFVNGEDKIPATALSKHNVTSFAEWLRRREEFLEKTMTVTIRQTLRYSDTLERQGKIK